MATGIIPKNLAADVDTLNSKLTGLQNNKTSSGVNLKNYTQSNPYTFPYDGYVLLDSGSSVQSGTHIWFNIRTANNYNVANLYMAVQQSYQSMSVFVKKGMFCFLYDATATNNFSITFYPLDMS